MVDEETSILENLITEITWMHLFDSVVVSHVPSIGGCSCEILATLLAVGVDVICKVKINLLERADGLLVFLFFLYIFRNFLFQFYKRAGVESDLSLW